MFADYSMLLKRVIAKGVRALSSAQRGNSKIHLLQWGATSITAINEQNQKYGQEIK